MTAKRFSLMGYRSNGGWPTVQMVANPEPEALLGIARQMADEGYERVEIWREGECLHTVRQPTTPRPALPASND
jgi:hypothetical protein